MLNTEKNFKKQSTITDSEECNNGGEQFLDIYIRMSITQR